MIRYMTYDDNGTFSDRYISITQSKEFDGCYDKEMVIVWGDRGTNFPDLVSGQYVHASKHYTFPS